MEAKIEGKMLVIRIELVEPHASKSGKSLTVASSLGCKPTGAMINGKPIIIGVNAFIAI